MAVGVTGDYCMVRCSEELKLGVRPMDFTGKPMKGFIFVAADVLKTIGASKAAGELAFVFSQLPPK